MGHKVLVIDDDETIRTAVETTLKKAGFYPILTENGEAGLQAAAHERPHAIVLDRKMPGMDGNEVLKHLKEKEETKKIPVIMLTGVKTVEDVSSSLELGAADYIVKPFDGANLTIRLKNIINKAAAAA